MAQGGFRHVSPIQAELVQAFSLLFALVGFAGGWINGRPEFLEQTVVEPKSGVSGAVMVDMCDAAVAV